MGKKKLKLPTENELSKKYNGSGKASDIKLSAEDSLWLPSSNIAINYLFGGGIPYGRILELYGEESSGKTLLAMDFAKCCQALGGIVLAADAEATYDTYWNEVNGIDNDKVILFQETAVETLSDWMRDQALYWRNKLINNEPILIILDSVAALDCADNIDSVQSDAKAEMGNRAKAIYKMFRIRNQLFNELGVCFIAINQLRQKVGASPYQDPDTTPGGSALKFYASIRCGIYGGKQIKAKINGMEERVGRLASIRIKKNKVGPPRPTLKTEVYFIEEYREPGFSRYIGFPEILQRVGVLVKKGSRYYFGDEMVSNGETALIAKIESDEKFRKNMIRKSKVNTISKMRVKLKKLEGNNQFPINGEETDE